MASAETNEALRWNDPSWLAAATGWIDERVERTGEVEQPHIYPWATALRVPTQDGPVWFKACVPELAHEVRTLELLAARRPELVPPLLASDRTEGWMLLGDAGTRLRDLEGTPGQIERWERAVAAYAQLQLDVAADADAFVAGGVPDRRGTRAVGELGILLVDEAALKPPVDEALSDGEIERLRALLPRIAEEAETLDALGLPDSIQHDDLHDANVFLRDGEYRIIDWGDSSIAQPLLSSSVMLQFVAWRLDVGADAPEVRRVRDAYLEPFTAFVPREELAAATPVVARLGQLSGALKWNDVVKAIPDWTRAEWVDAVPYKLRLLVELCA